MATDVEAKDPLRAAVKAQGQAAVKPGAEADESEMKGQEPVIVDLGSKNRKQVRKLRRGKPCRLLRRVEETIEHLREGGELGENVRPIIIVVRERRRSNAGRRVAKMWGLG